MKILYISYDGMCDVLGRSQVIPYIQGLAAKGHIIHVLSFEKAGVSESESAEVLRIFRKSQIEWHPQRFRTNPPMFAKIFDLIEMLFISIKLYKRIKFDIAHCRSYIAAFAGLALKRRYNVKFVFDIRGFWIDERIEGKIWSLANPIFRLFYYYLRKKEKQFYKYADAVICLTHNGKSVIKNRFGEYVAEKTTVIPCCADTNLFSREQAGAEALSLLRKKLEIDENAFVVSYLGSTGTWYMTDEMLLLFKKILKKYQNSVFLFISGDDPGLIKGKALRIGIPIERVIVKKAHREEVPLHIMLSHISICFIKPVSSKIASSPTKQAEILSMGIPLICNAGIGDTDLLFEDSSFGILVKGFSDNDLEMAVKQIDAALQIDPEEIRAKAIKYFDLGEGIEKYNYIYNHL